MRVWTGPSRTGDDAHAASVEPGPCALEVQRERPLGCSVRVVARPSRGHAGDRREHDERPVTLRSRGGFNTSGIRNETTLVKFVRITLVGVGEARLATKLVAEPAVRDDGDIEAPRAADARSTLLGVARVVEVGRLEPDDRQCAPSFARDVLEPRGVASQQEETVLRAAHTRAPSRPRWPTWLR